MSDSATVNLWTSTNGVDYSLADSAIVTETGVDYAFTKTFDAVGLTISYRFETINTNGTSSWCSTNEVATFVNHYNNLTQHLKDSAKAKEVLEKAKITPNLRPQEISLEGYLSLLKAIC